MANDEGRVPATQVTFQGHLLFTAEASDTGTAGQCKAGSLHAHPARVSAPTCDFRGTQTPRLSKRKYWRVSNSEATTRFRRRLCLEARRLLVPVSWVSGAPLARGSSLGPLFSAESPWVTSSPPRPTAHPSRTPGPVPVLLEAVPALGPCGPGFTASALLPR